MNQQLLWVAIICIFVQVHVSLCVFAQNMRQVENMVLEDIPEVPESLKARLLQYQNSRFAVFSDWLPNNAGILISTRFGNTNQLHIVNRPNAARQQITYFEEPIYGGSYCPSPDYNGFLFSKDAGGNEFSQLYWYNMNTRQYDMISDGESKNSNVKWSNKGDRFAFISTRRNGRDFDMYISNISSPKSAELILDKGNGYWIPTKWSPDDRKILVVQYMSSSNSQSYIVDVKTKEVNPISDTSKEYIFQAIDWSDEGNLIYAISDEGREFQTLVTYNIKDKKVRLITEDIPWNVEDFTMNQNKTKAAFIVNNNGISQLYIYNVASGSYERIKNIPLGQLGSLRFHPSRDELGFTLSSSQTPGDVYTLDVNLKALRRWTTSEVGGLTPDNFVIPKLIDFESFDQVDGKPRKIPAFIYTPKNAQGPWPVLMMVHGGPESQFTPAFRPFVNFIVNELGIAVIAPNVRGSTGYGKTYQKLDNGFNRENSVKDIGELIKWIGNNSEFDKNRIGIYGGSYGGYMVLSSLYNFNNQLKCGIDVVGISNFVTFLENTQEYRRDLRRVEYGDERDAKMREYLESISPNNHASEIISPLFVIQGANDPRVPESESTQMVKSIRENGGIEHAESPE